jgi:serine/threonine-protein kinase
LSSLGTVGKYELRAQLGRGAMGVVYEAFDTVIERRVALKLLRTDVFAAEQLADVRARFKREAHSAGKLSHPNIVTIFDYGEHEGAPYIVMDLMSGQELSRRLEAGARLPLAEAVKIIGDLLAALSYAPEGGVVHRDIKPSNLFLLRDGTLKVVDFGVARIESSELTETGAILGTPAYMSPEQFLGLPVDGRSDLFSVGVILYHLLTGDRPFSGSPTTIMQKVLRQDPIEPTALNPTLAADWDIIIKRALAKKPEQRFQSARQFADAIRFVMEGKALPKAPEFLNDATVQVPGGMKAQEPAQSQPAKSRAWVVFTFGAAALAAAAVAVTLHFTRQPPPAPVVIANPKPIETPKPEPVAERPAPVVVEAPAPPPPAPKEKLRERIVEKRAEKKVLRQAERKQRVIEEPAPPPVAALAPAPPPKPAAPVFRGKVVSLDRSWGFAVVELAERGSVKSGDRLTAMLASGRRVDMVVRRVSGNLASAVPDGRLSDDLVGASVTRN